MKPSRRLPTILLTLCLGFLLQHLNGAMAVQAQQVQVTAANPASTEQGTVNLDVKVTGKGFKNGARAKWFVTGTTDPGGVTVNTTTFVSSTEVTANITVSDTAVIANFDIQVLNSDGRGGKGTELFRVTADCPPQQPQPTSDTKCYVALPGCLDSTFGGIGYVHMDPFPAYPSNGDQATAVVVQPDGKIVVTGVARISSTSQALAVIRYNLDGSLDTSFGDVDLFNAPSRLGYAITSITTGFDWTRAVALQPDGKIIVTASGGAVFAVLRYNTNGSLDNSFGSSGIARFNGPVRDVAIQADGKIVTGGSGGFSLARLNPNGSLDSTFGSGGYVSVNPGGSKRGSATGLSLAIQRVPAVTGEERIVLGGYSSTSSQDNSDWTLMRFRANGATDTTFGTNGIVKTVFAGFPDQLRKVRIDSSNRIVAAGTTYSSSNECGSYVIDYAVARYMQDGSLDGSFSGGKQVIDVYGGGENLFGMAIQLDDKIVLLGPVGVDSPLSPYFGLVRLNADGSRDVSFGIQGNGAVTTELWTQSWALALALHPSDGRIVAAGSSYLGPSFTQGEIVVARYLP